MFENIQSTYNTYFAGAERPLVPDYMPCTTSYKLLAEVPIQRKALYVLIKPGLILNPDFRLLPWLASCICPPSGNVHRFIVVQLL